DKGGQRKFLEGLEEEGIAGLLIDLVPGEDSDKTFYLIDELVKRIARIRIRIEVLEEKGPPSKRADFGALQKAITEEVKKAIGGLKKEV
ncbi:hypothetical protein QBC43DRAFT_294916, partial [Cladorrhinum sp. PSN259]